MTLPIAAAVRLRAVAETDWRSRGIYGPFVNGRELQADAGYRRELAEVILAHAQIPGETKANGHRMRAPGDPSVAVNTPVSSLPDKADTAIGVIGPSAGSPAAKASTPIDPPVPSVDDG